MQFLGHPPTTWSHYTIWFQTFVFVNSSDIHKRLIRLMSIYWPFWWVQGSMPDKGGSEETASRKVFSRWKKGLECYSACQGQTLRLSQGKLKERSWAVNKMSIEHLGIQQWQSKVTVPLELMFSDSRAESIEPLLKPDCLVSDPSPPLLDIVPVAS